MKGRTVAVGVRTNGLGHKECLTMTESYARAQQGRSKGGRKVQETGTGHRWSSESARKAVLRRWRAWHRKRKEFGGRRVGLRSKWPLQPNKALLRDWYSKYPAKGIWYDPKNRQWMTTSTYGHSPYCIKERTALIRLGHIQGASGFVPEDIIPAPQRRKTCIEKEAR